MRIIISFVLLLLVISVHGQETAQFRGPSRDGIFPEKGLIKKWPDGGPKLMVQIEGIGKGYSQPVVYKGIIYITGIKQDTMDVISAYDLKGTLLWDKVYGHSWANSYSDTRSTPTIQDNKIYLVGGMGTLCCLDAANGNVLWSQDPHKQFKGEYHRWGVAESVLLTDQAAIYVTGGEETSVVAYDKITGKLFWKTKSMGGTRAYASPSLIERNNLKIIIAQTANDLMGINALNGEIIWNFSFIPYHLGESGKGANTNMPIYHNGEIFVTSGYDHPATMFSLSGDGRSVSLKWKNDTMDTHHGGTVLVDGNLYGTNWLNNTKGQWVSINWNTGKTNWVKDWFTKGSIVSAENLLYCYEEKGGNVALVQPDVNDFKIISTFKVEAGAGPYWAHPAIYNGMLFLRHGNVLMIYDIKGV